MKKLDAIIIVVMIFFTILNVMMINRPRKIIILDGSTGYGMTAEETKQWLTDYSSHNKLDKTIEFTKLPLKEQ